MVWSYTEQPFVCCCVFGTVLGTFIITDIWILFTMGSHYAFIAHLILRALLGGRSLPLCWSFPSPSCFMALDVPSFRLLSVDHCRLPCGFPPHPLYPGPLLTSPEFLPCSGLPFMCGSPLPTASAPQPKLLPDTDTLVVSVIYVWSYTTV